MVVAVDRPVLGDWTLGGMRVLPVAVEIRHATVGADDGPALLRRELAIPGTRRGVVGMRVHETILAGTGARIVRGSAGDPDVPIGVADDAVLESRVGRDRMQVGRV